MFGKDSITGISLQAAGLVALADLKMIACRTALTGSASYADILFLAPGIHTHQNASNVNGGELPATGAMTTGYCFRIENQATVSYLQGVGRPGCLVNVFVSPTLSKAHGGFKATYYGIFSIGVKAQLIYLLGPLLTIIVVALVGAIHDWWALGVLGMLMLARLINVVVIKRRSVLGWKGALEPGVEGDLIILLSQDRWIRLRGLVDDLKAVTSGQWLRDATPTEDSAVAVATLLVFVAAALANNASTVANLLVGCLLLLSAGILAIANAMTQNLRMFDRIVQVRGQPKAYKRRLDLADELVEIHKRDDWAIALGMIVPKDSSRVVEVTM